MITHVAIIWKDKLYSLPKPARHHHVIQLIHEQTGDINIYGKQGFLANDDTYLDRRSAKLEAIAAGQIKESPHDELYSEDLW